MRHADRNRRIHEQLVERCSDESLGKAVCAFVALRPGQQTGPRDLLLFLRDHLAACKAPARFEFLDAVARKPSGKSLRRELREAFWRDRDRQVNRGERS